MVKTLKAVTATLLAVSLLISGAEAQAATVKVGAKCSKLNAKAKTTAKQSVVCKKKSGKLKWVLVGGTNQGGAAGDGAPDASADLLDDPNTTLLAYYAGGSGPGGNASGPVADSVPLPGAAPAGSDGFNVKLWVFDPNNPTQQIASNAVFVNDTTGWVLHNLDSNGYLLANWQPGVYSVDTIEPFGDSANFKRHTYSITVDSNNQVAVEGLKVNASGFFTLTVDKASHSAPDAYQPVNPCQLRYQVAGDETVSNGFPRHSARLPNQGTVHALIVPVDFADVPGAGNPASVFFSMAKGTHDFYKRMSAGKVTFDFKVVKSWQRMSFASNKYNLGAWNGGDSNGYYKALLQANDPVVDYSQFDVVYFLSPPTIPWKSIAYGPAFPRIYQTADGPIRAGTFSGADAYQSLPGAGWKWMSHETGHLFGLQDLYTNGVDATFGAWDLMSLNWTNEFLELTSWNRYIQGWLPESQLACLTPGQITPTGQDLVLAPLERVNTNLKAVAVPLSDSLILVIESRRAEGMDHTSSHQPAGTLVYTVDMKIASIKGAWHLITPRPVADTSQFTDGALKVGDSVTVGGITVKVVSQTQDGDTIHISK